MESWTLMPQCERTYEALYDEVREIFLDEGKSGLDYSKVVKVLGIFKRALQSHLAVLKTILGKGVRELFNILEQLKRLFKV